jgi:polysaccharide deacetylase family protein (PEP-CTERM system associated)
LQNILSVDLEEWYHPEYVRTGEEVPNKKDRITESLDKTLDLLNSQDVRATFFVVGELLERHPEILERLSDEGHEISFHGFYHQPLSELNVDTFRSEIQRFGALVGKKCLGFRAPSFSLSNKTKWALKILEAEDYRYDSSIFPFKTPLYGHWTAPIRPYRISHENVTSEDDSSRLWEFSLLAYSFAGIRMPAAGGFYLRFLPTNLISRAIRKVNKLGFPAVLFFHNWELDTETPHMNLGLYKSFVTYHKLNETKHKLDCLLSRYKFSSIENYMTSNGLC